LDPSIFAFRLQSQSEWFSFDSPLHISLAEIPSSLLSTWIAAFHCDGDLIMLFKAMMVSIFCISKLLARHSCSDNSAFLYHFFRCFFASGVHTVKVFSYSELTKATQNFIDANKIGEGGFGSVFRVSMQQLLEECLNVNII
jgi:hypothetical protein